MRSVIHTSANALVGRFVDASAERIALETAARDGAAPGVATAAGVNPEASAFALVWMTERTLHQMLVAEGAVSDEELVRALGRIWIATVYGS